MISIKINIKVVILAVIISILMYPTTIESLSLSVKNIYIANKLSTSDITTNNSVVDSKKVRIVFMFDDGWSSVYSEAYDVLKKSNYKASVPIIPSLVDEKEYMSYEELSELYLQGWDLLNHSYSHKKNIYENTDKLFSDFNIAKQWMENRYLGRYSDMVVMPYGEINPYLISQLKDTGYRNIRTSDNIIILNQEQIDYLPVYTINLLTDVSVNEVKDLLIKENIETKIIIIILHKIADGDESYGMSYSKVKFEQVVNFIEENNDQFEVITYSEIF